MDFLFAIPIFIFNLISSLFSWVFSVISGIVGIVLWPVKLLWGLLMWVGKTLISIVLLPTLLFSHSGDISATQPVVGTSATVVSNTYNTSATVVSNTYNIEQIYNNISQLEKAGRDMQPLRNSYRNLECGDTMREYQSQAEKLVEITNDLPQAYRMRLGEAAKRLNSCVSCETDAKKVCDTVLSNLSEYKSWMSEE